jgi:hypothetical protein
VDDGLQPIANNAANTMGEAKRGMVDLFANLGGFS